MVHNWQVVGALVACEVARVVDAAVVAVVRVVAYVVGVRSAAVDVGASLVPAWVLKATGVVEVEGGLTTDNNFSFTCAQL